MNKSTFTILLGLFLAAGWTPAAAGPAADEPSPQLRILADSQEYYFDEQRFRADGNVQVTYSDITLTADTVTGDPRTGDLEAAGNVTFRQRDRTLTGESFSYNFLTDLGLAQDASASIDDILFHGEELKVEPDRYTISQSRFTTCHAAKPHYYISARELVVQPGIKLKARGVSIVLLERKLLNVPGYTIYLAEKGKRKSPLPPVGVGGRYGFYTGYKFDLSREPVVSGALDVRLSTRQVLQGGLEYRRLAGKPAFANLTYRQPYYGGLRSDLLLSRLPEIGIRFHSGRMEETELESDDPLYLSGRLLDPVTETPPKRGVNLLGQVGFGRFIEEPFHTKSQRLDARAVAWMDSIRIDSKTLISPGVSIRYSNYSSGEEYRSLGFRLAAARRLGSRSYISASYITHAVEGGTPFNFDAVEIPHELAARIAFPVGSLSLEIGGRYDVRNGSLFDSEISVAKVMHCLEPKISWRNRFREISLDVGIVGF